MSVHIEQLEPPAAQRLAVGEGALDQLGRLIREHGGSRVLLVTDPGIVSAGHVDRARRALAGLLAATFDRVRENPTTDCVDECVNVAREANVDLIVGLGGGSSMDTAKGCNFVLTNGGTMADYQGRGKATRPLLPMIAAPTTAGTGSECQSFALISDAATHRKMACGDPKALPAVALLDPSLTLTQPPHVTANSGIDAIAHAVETAVTAERTEASLALSRRAFSMMNHAFERVLADPADRAARAAMQHGAALAGRAIELSMLGAAHAAANPLTARFGIVHGSAVGLMLPAVVRFNAADQAIARQYEQVTGLAPEALAARLEALLDAAKLPRTLDQAGVDPSRIDELAADAAEQWTGTFNPRKVDAETFAALYHAVR